MSEKTVTPSFHFIHQPTEVPTSSQSCKFVGGLGSHRAVCLKKAKQLEVFCLSLFWNLNFGISKVKFVWYLWSFCDMIWQDVSFLSMDKQFILHLWASFNAKFWQKDKSFFWVKKYEKNDSSPPFTFLTVNNQKWIMCPSMLWFFKKKIYYKCLMTYATRRFILFHGGSSTWDFSNFIFIFFIILFF